MNILVVEDEFNNMKLLTLILRKYGHETIEAYTGAQGLEKAASSRPDIILMDLRLPDMDGFETTRRIRNIITNVPIIAITSYSRNEVNEEIIKSGFTGLIEKPIDPGTIMKDIERISGMRDHGKIN